MKEKAKPEEFTKYEKARILGARALQISMNAPLLIDISKEDLEKLHYDSFNIANLEFENGCLPISVKRPMPQRKESKLELERRKLEVEKEKDSLKLEEKEKDEEKDIQEKGEIMELVKSEDEDIEEVSEKEEQGI
jgi:DNA-directed RNA polymerase subunit K